jgi:hypothetical protein
MSSWESTGRMEVLDLEPLVTDPNAEPLERYSRQIRFAPLEKRDNDRCSIAE